MPNEVSPQEIDVINELAIAELKSKFDSARFDTDETQRMLFTVLSLILKSEGTSAQSIEKVSMLAQFCFRSGIVTGVKMLTDELESRRQSAMRSTIGT